MIKLPPPELDAGDVFRTCISRIRDIDLKERLSTVEPDVIDAAVNFEQLATNTCLHQFAREAVVGGVVSTAEMEAVYTQRMAKKRAPGRDIYDKLISLAPYGKCPLCGHRTVSTLDHHLPKAHYPILVVTPLNLVPSCSDCNKSKLSSHPASAREETLHPYFDDIEGEQWLFAEVLPSSPATLLFRVDAPEVWDEILVDRVALHFKTLGLASLYASQAADELLNIRHQLRIIHVAGGAAAVQLEMHARAESCREININSWRTATFEAFARSDWFCDGGFDQA